MGELYKLEFPNGKSYVGISRVGGRARFATHAYEARRSASTLPLYQAWRKYGAPQLVVLAMLEDAELPTAEIRAIAAFGTLKPDGYNVAIGGQSGAMQNPEVAAKVAAALRGRKLSPEHRESLRRAHLGKSQPPDQVEKRSAALRGRTLADTTRAKIAESNRRAAATPSEKRIAARLAHAERLRGRKHTEAHRAAIAAGNKGRVVTAETRAKIAAAHKGRKYSEERREAMRSIPQSSEKGARISAALRGRRQSPEAIEARRLGKLRRRAERGIAEPCSMGAN